MVALGSQSHILNIAHRGACSLAPENTIAAARKALQVGAGMWELDVQMTADGELIAVHDRTLERTSNVRNIFPGRHPWLLHQFSLDEIRLLDFGSWFADQDPFGLIAAGVVPNSDLTDYAGEPAPTLEDALNFTLKHGWRANVEIKDLSGLPGDGDIVKKVIAQVEKLNMADHVLITSFKQSYLAQIRESHADICTGILVSKRHPRPDTLLRQLGAQAYHPRRTAIRPADISILNRLGFSVNVWNVNQKKTMKRMIRHGVSGIFTDFPQVLSSVLTGLDDP